MTEPRKEPIIGGVIDHYRVDSLIGEGGMGDVYLAQDTRLGRHVARKLLSRELTLQPERVRRFQQEARAASALNHPNILTIHEIGAFRNCAFPSLQSSSKALPCASA